MMALAARPLAVITGLGWLFTIIASVAGLSGLPLPTWLLTTTFFVMFPIWCVAIIMMNKLSAGVAQKDLWKAALRGCPKWLRYAIYGAWGYSFLMFLLVSSGRHEAAMIGFIGTFYAAAFGTFVTAANAGDEPTKCVNGHQIGPFDKFCRECGAEIKRNNSVPLVS